jgi:hypothetical protein
MCLPRSMSSGAVGNHDRHRLDVVHLVQRALADRVHRRDDDADENDDQDCSPANQPAQHAVES